MCEISLQRGPFPRSAHPAGRLCALLGVHGCVQGPCVRQQLLVIDRSEVVWCACTAVDCWLVSVLSDSCVYVCVCVCVCVFV